MFNLRTTFHDTPQDTLAEKEFLLIQEISRKPNSTQRDLSENLACHWHDQSAHPQARAQGHHQDHAVDWKRTEYLLT